MSRLGRHFMKLAVEGRAALVTYVMASDPDRATSQAILNGLPGAGADIIEFGMPFTDPMADGPSIQLAAQRALAAGGSLSVTLDMVREFRQTNDKIPVILMGYFNPIYSWGVEKFCADAAQAGIDGLIIVDIPPEEGEELKPFARANKIDVIALTTPTSDDARLPVILNDASGFIYYVSIAGITGTASASQTAIADAVARIRRHSPLPICVGFGIKTPEQAAQVAKLAEGVVVGSAIVQSAADAAAAGTDAVAAALGLVRQLSAGVRSVVK